MQLTPNLKLKKPEGTDNVNIDDFNGNADILDTAITGKVDKVTGKGLSTEDYTPAEKSKLTGIAAGANNYVHPASHPASMITQDASNRFVTDAEKTVWNAKASTSSATGSAAGLMSAADKSKLDGIAAGAQVNKVTSVAGKTGAVVLTKGDVGLGSVDNIQQASLATYNAHLADYIRQPGYGITAGSGTVYAITLTPAMTAYTDGVSVAIKTHVTNTGAATLNVNNLGAKSILDSSGASLTSGRLIANGIYTLRYNGTAFILQGEGGGLQIASGTLSISSTTLSFYKGDSSRVPLNYVETELPFNPRYIYIWGRNPSIGNGNYTFFNRDNVIGGVSIAPVVAISSPQIYYIQWDGNYICHAQNGFRMPVVSLNGVTSMKYVALE
ncbi:hypothetical protein D3P07_23135 [Paenibacillus sp. 1011MAR3C5]|uniref:hypothetical protein n=1 Tax=Paenibacillus sp. 1011MAR3C5 TaxID=1675787 RepID=UPI000E6C9977|nr:hypothetical protein [Paenibacillus sp. 1011MAR3C5]RJE84267.1 hypothetical protein D3P07_23135 [Paenibacillus sp. 1011MAR3C5]